MRTVKDTNRPPWIDNEVRRLIRKKYKALNQYRINRSAARKRKLRSITQQIKYLIRSKHQGYLAKIESSLCDNPKMFWSYHKSILHHRTGKMRSKVESVQRRATSWIMQAKRGEVSYKQRLITLSLLPLCYDREIKDLVFFFKALYGRIDLDVHSFVSFNNNGRTRLCTNPSLTLKVPLCKSKTFQSSYFNRLVKLWNHVCKIAPSTTFASLSSFKRSLKAAYGNLVMTTFDVDLPCTWTLVRDCPCHRS